MAMTLPTAEPASSTESQHLGAIGTLADRLRTLRQQKDDLEAQTKTLNGEIEQVQQTLVEKMLEDEVQSIRRDGTLYSITRKTYRSVKAGGLPALVDWLKANELSCFVTETVDSAGLFEWVGEQRQDERELPGPVAEAISEYDRISIQMRRSR